MTSGVSRARLRRFFAIDWKHAIGELTLIVAGVLIALAVNDWNQARQDRRTEVEALGEIRAALAEDLQDIRGDLDRHRRAVAAGEELLAGLGQAGACGDRVGEDVAALLSAPLHVSNTAAYESVKSRGLGLIGDDSLRLAIIHLYAYRNTVIDIANERGNRFVDDVLRPFVRARFRLDATGRLTPVDCRSLLGDPAFRNLLVEDLGLRRYAISRYEPTEVEIPTLRAAIQREARR